MSTIAWVHAETMGDLVVNEITLPCMSVEDWNYLRHVNWTL